MEIYICQRYHFIKIPVNQQTPVILFFILFFFNSVINVDVVKPCQLTEFTARF